MTLVSHFGNIAFLLLIIAGPIPLCLAIIYSWFGSEKGVFHNLFLLITGWCVLSTSFVLLLGTFRLLTQNSIIILEIILLVLGSVIIFAQMRRNGSLLHRLFQEYPAFNHIERVLLLVLGLISLCFLWFIISTPIHEYDSYWYHLPNMVRWYQEGHLQRFPIGGMVKYYPYQWEALSTLLLFPFHNDFWVGFPNWLAWLLNSLSIIICSKELGAGREKAILCAGLTLLTPVFYQQVTTMHIDIALSAFFMASLGNMLLFNRTRHPGYLAFLFSTAGMMIGIKMSGLPYLALLILLLAALELKARWTKRKISGFATLNGLKQFTRKRNSIILVGGAVLGIFLGGYWYFQNSLACSNPLGVMQIRLGQYKIPPLDPACGPMDHLLDYVATTTLAAWFDVRMAVYWNILFSALKTSGGFGLLIIAILALLQPLSIISKKRAPLPHFSLIICYGLLTAAGTLYWYTPYAGGMGNNDLSIIPWISQAHRLALPLFNVLGICAACTATWLNIPRALLLLFPIIPITALLTETRLANEALGLLAIFLAYTISLKLPLFSSGKYRLWFITVASLILLTAAFSMSLQAQENRITRRDQLCQLIYTFLDQNTHPGEKIGFLHNQSRRYLLYGPNLDRRPVVVWSEGKMDQQTWIKYLIDNEIELVAFGPGKKVGAQMQEYEWLQDTNYFIRVYGNDFLTETVFYKLKR